MVDIDLKLSDEVQPGRYPRLGERVPMEGTVPVKEETLALVNYERHKNFIRRQKWRN